MTRISPACVQRESRRLSRAPDTGAKLVAAYGAPGIRADRDTTHLSVIDGEGSMVALTTSIGPHFGAGIADPVHGVLFAHSYRMASAAGARRARRHGNDADARHRRRGAPSGHRGRRAANVFPARCSRFWWSGWCVAVACPRQIAAPRCNWMGGALRLHHGHPAREHFEARGYTILHSPRDHRQHLGIVAGGRAPGLADRRQRRSCL